MGSMNWTAKHIFLFPQLDDELIKTEKFTIEYISKHEHEQGDEVW